MSPILQMGKLRPMEFPLGLSGLRTRLFLCEDAGLIPSLAQWVSGGGGRETEAQSCNSHHSPCPYIQHPKQVSCKPPFALPAAFGAAAFLKGSGPRLPQADDVALDK